MPLDPEQQFVISFFCRKGIALALNHYLDAHKCLTDDRLKPDDDRLTDEICAAYAKAHGEIDYGLGENAVDEAIDELEEETLRKIGIDPSVC